MSKENMVVCPALKLAGAKQTPPAICGLTGFSLGLNGNGVLRNHACPITDITNEGCEIYERCTTERELVRYGGSEVVHNIIVRRIKPEYIKCRNPEDLG